MRANAAATLAGALLAALVAACSSGPEGERSTAAFLVNVSEGNYGGVRLGDESSKVEQSFGPAEVSTEGPAAPSAAKRFRGPMSIPLPRLDKTSRWFDTGPPLYRYRDTAFITDGAKVIAIVIESRDAVTEHGVRVGDPLVAASAAYDLTCRTALGWSEVDVFHACFGEVAPERFVWFGGDPIENITIGSVPLTSAGGYEASAA
jgi:hypothetical protein